MNVYSNMLVYVYTAHLHRHIAFITLIAFAHKKATHTQPSQLICQNITRNLPTNIWQEGLCVPQVGCVFGCSLPSFAFSFNWTAVESRRLSLIALHSTQFRMKRNPKPLGWCFCFVTNAINEYVKWIIPDTPLQMNREIEESFLPF